MKRTMMLGSALLVAVLPLGGCGSTTSSTTTAAVETSPAADAGDCGGGVEPQVVRGNRYFDDYNVLPNLSAAVERHEVALGGRVTGWSEGRSVSTGDMITRYATVTVQVDLAAKVADPSQCDIAYVAVGLGSDPVGPAGDPLASFTVQGALVATANGCTVSLRAQDEDLSSWTVHAAELAGNEATATTSPGSFQNLVDELASSTAG